MLKAWVILLVCGLLPFSQGVVQNVFSVAQLHKSVLEEGILDTMAQDDLLQGLLGGGLLGGILDGVNPGSFLDGQGVGKLPGDKGLTESPMDVPGGGLLGGLTGGGGLLGGLLGGKGGLLHGVLGGNGGNLLGGLLGGEGLLGSILKIHRLELLKVSLKLLEGVGADLNIYTHVDLELLNHNILVEVNITGRARMVQDKSGAPKLVVEKCHTLLGGVKIRLGLLPLNLDRVLSNLLNNLLPGVLCPVIDLVLNIVNILLGTVNSVCPFGMLGQLHYTLAGLPVFSGQHILLNLNLMITDPEGKTINLPPVQLPALPAPVPGDLSSQLVLPGEILTTLIGTLASEGLLNVDITQQTVRGNIPMTTTALQSLIPEISHLRAPSLPLVVRIRVNASPKVALQNGEVSVTLGASIGVLAHTRSGPKTLFELDANIVLVGKITVESMKLGVSLSLKSLALKLASSEIGVIHVALLEGWMKNLIVSEYVPLINGVLLDIGIPLPNLFNLKYDDAVVSVVKNTFVVGMPPKLL